MEIKSCMHSTTAFRRVDCQKTTHKIYKYLKKISDNYGFLFVIYSKMYTLKFLYFIKLNMYMYTVICKY